MHHLHSLSQADFACTEDESRDVEDCIAALSRALIRYNASVASVMPWNVCGKYICNVFASRLCFCVTGSNIAYTALADTATLNCAYPRCPVNCIQLVQLHQVQQDQQFLTLLLCESV